MKKQGKGLRIFYLVFVFFFSATVILAADPASGASRGPILSRILKKGQLTVGMSGHMPPFNMKNKAGIIFGLDADLSKEIATGLGVKLKIAEMPFADLLKALENGKIDMVLSGMTITAERNLNVVFVGPYMISGQAIFAKKNKLEAVKKYSEVGSQPLTLGAIKGSTGHLYVKEFFPKAKFIASAHMDDAVQMVLQDKVDAFVADYPSCIVATLRHPDKELTMMLDPLTYEPLGIALPAGDPHFVNWVENSLRRLQGNGRLDKMKTRWLEDGTWVSNLP